MASDAFFDRVHPGTMSIKSRFVVGAFLAALTIPLAACPPGGDDCDLVIPRPPEYLRDYLLADEYKRQVVRAHDTALCEPSGSTTYTESSCSGEIGHRTPDKVMKTTWFDVIGEVPTQRDSLGDGPPMPDAPVTSVRAVFFEDAVSTAYESATLGSVFMVDLYNPRDDIEGQEIPVPEGGHSSECYRAAFEDPYSCGPYGDGRVVHIYDGQSEILRISDDEVCRARIYYSIEDKKMVEEVITSNVGEKPRYCWPRRQLDCLVTWRAGQGSTPPDCGPNELPYPPRVCDPLDGGCPLNDDAGTPTSDGGT